MVEAPTATITNKENDEFLLYHRSPTESNYLYECLSSTILHHYPAGSPIPDGIRHGNHEISRAFPR